MVKKINAEEFVNDAMKSAAAIVDFSATWCGPCRMMAPVLEKLSDEMSGKADFYNLDVDEAPEVAAKFGLPCVDLQKEFCDYLQYRHSSYVMWDRVHPGWVGSMLIAKALLKEMGFDRPLI